MPYDPLNPSARDGVFGAVSDGSEDQPFVDAWDTIEASPRGVVGAAKGAYNLADTLTGDWLTDWNENPFGESTSTIGSLVEGLSSFAAGFAVADPAMGFLGQLAGAGSLSGKAAAAYKIGKGIVAGAITDFTVWDGHQQRLSNLIQEVPALRNPISEFLAADPNDSQVVGRLKMALEGAGLGAFVESTLLGLRKIGVFSKTMRDLTEAAGGPENLDAAKHQEIQSKAALEAEKQVPSNLQRMEFDDAHSNGAILPKHRDPGEASGWDRQTRYEEYTPEEQKALSVWQKSQKRAEDAADIADKARQTNDLGVPQEESYRNDRRIRARNNQLDRDAAAAPKRVGDRVRLQDSDTLYKVVDTHLDGGLDEIKIQIPGSSDQPWIKSSEALLAHDDAWRMAHGEDLTDMQILRRESAARRRGAPEKPTSLTGTSDNPRDVALGGPASKLSPDQPDLTVTTPEGPTDFWGRPLEAPPRDPNAPLGPKEKARPSSGKPTAPGGPPVSGAPLAGEIRTPRPLSVEASEFFSRSAAHMKTNLRMTDQQFSDLREFMADPKNIENAAAEMGVNPAKLTPAQLLAFKMPKNTFNLEHIQMTDAAVALVRENERMFLDANESLGTRVGLQVSLKESEADGLQVYKELIGSKSDLLAAATAARDLSRDEFHRLAGLDARFAATGFSLASISEAIAKKLQATRKMGPGGGDQFIKDSLQVMEAANMLTETRAYMRGSRNEAGRGLGSLRGNIEGQDFPAFVGDMTGNMPRLREIANEQGGVQHLMKNLDMLGEAFGAGGRDGTIKLGKVAEALTSGPFKAAGGMLFETWINAILSGPRSFTINAMGPALFSFFRPLELALGSAVLKTGETIAGRGSQAAAQSTVMSEAFGQFVNLTSGLPEFVKTMRELGLNNVDVFDTRIGTSLMDSGSRAPAITAANAGLRDDSAGGRAVNWFGSAVRLPTTVLGSTDNGIKLLVFRAAARSRLTVEALQSGKTAGEAAQYVEDTMNRLVHKNQIYSNRQLYNRGLEEAATAGLQGDAAKTRALKYIGDQIAAHPTDGALSKFGMEEGWDSTLTKPAEEGSWSWSLQGLRGRHPMLRPILPFINTPIRIMEAAAQRMDPFGPAKVILNAVFDNKWTSLEGSRNRFVRDFSSPDPRVRASAIGRITTGYSIAGTVYGLAASGYITGRGPPDPAQQKTLKDAGWLPYAIKTETGYVSYVRLDPLASLIGSAADVVNYGAYAPLEDQGKISTMSMGIVVAIANNLTNKTYLQGVANILDAATDPANKMSKLARNYASSFVPNILGQGVSAVGDDTSRDVRGMVDAMIAKLPGLSSILPPARNVLGEPIKKPMATGGAWGDWWLPVAYNSTTDDMIRQELASLGHGFTPMTRTVGGLDLTEIKAGQTNAYDRWGELLSETTIASMSLRDALRKRISSQQYQQAMPETIGETISPRVAMLNSIVSKYREAAYRKLMQENPAVLTNDMTMRTNRLAAKRGDPLTLLNR